jgi:acetylornithine deacetylase
MDPLLQTLSELIAFDTRNPGGDETALATSLAERLSACRPDRLHVASTETGHAYVLAAFGTPRTLVNAHIDTVPAAPGWSRPPHRAWRDGGRLYGLGACDTKGAIAAILHAAARERPTDTLILFSGDEEHRGSAMRDFLGTSFARGLERAIVCEPTSLRAGTRHRGIMAGNVRARGSGGHSSRADQSARPLAQLGRLAARMDDWGQAKLQGGDAGFAGMCLNLAAIAGGVAFNIIPSELELVWSVRPPPGVPLATVHAELNGLLSSGEALEIDFQNPSFATRDPRGFAPLIGERAHAPVDLGFWTEAALLAEAGIDAVVIGPGDIALAHAADEWVAEGELVQAETMFAEMFRGQR